MKHILLILLLCPLVMGAYSLTWETCANPETLYQYLTNPATAGDWTFDGTYDVIWDQSAYTMHFNDNAILSFGNTSTTPDMYMRWDGTNFDILPSTAGYDLNIGSNTLGIDLIWNSDTSGDYVQFDEENVRVSFIDVDILMDDAANLVLGDSSDVVIDWSGTSLRFVPASAGSDFTIGTNTFGMDFLWNSDTSGDYIQFDEENVLALYSDVDIVMQDAYQLFGSGPGTKIEWNGTDLQCDIDGPVVFTTTKCLFNANPVSAKIAGGAATGTTGDENCFAVNGTNFEYHILGAGQTILAPSQGTNGLSIDLDDADDEGLEIGQGILASSKSAFTIGTDAFYIRVKFYIADVADTDDCAVGFRLAEAYQANLDDYNSWASLNVISGNITIEEETNGGGTDTDDTTDDWASTETHTLGVYVSAAKAVTYTIDDAAPSSTEAFTWTDTDVVVPFFYFLHAGANDPGVELISWECGLQSTQF